MRGAKDRGTFCVATKKERPRVRGAEEERGSFLFGNQQDGSRRRGAKDALLYIIIVVTSVAAIVVFVAGCWWQQLKLANFAIFCYKVLLQYWHMPKNSLIYLNK